MSQTAQTAVAVIGIDIGKNSFHIVGHDERGAIVLRQKWSRGQVEAQSGCFHLSASGLHRPLGRRSAGRA
jgi:transposase